MIASALLRHGPDHLADLSEGIERWLEEHEYRSVEQAKGSLSQRNVANPIAFARANYAQAVTSFVSPYDWRMASQPQS
jgi:dihydroorotate dehydrogenase (fumarate)